MSDEKNPMSSPYYGRLKAVSELTNFIDSLFETVGNLTLDAAFKEARELVTKVKENPGLTGKVGEMIDKQLNSYLSAYELHEKNINNLKKSHDSARQAIAEAGETYRNLSPELLSPLESGIQNVTEKVEWAGVLMPVEKYLDGLEQQNNQKREELAKKALDTMAKSLKQNRPDVKAYQEQGDVKHFHEGIKPSPNNDSGGSGGGGGASGGGSIPGGGASGGGSIPGGSGAGVISAAGLAGGAGAAAAKYATGGLQPGTDGVMRPASPSTASGGVGSFKDAQWPQDALKYPINSRMTADGPVGGYLPADVGNANDPRWRSDYTHPAIGSAGEPKAGFVGGMLTPGAGALAGGGAGALAARGMGALAARGMGSAAAGIGGIGSIGGGTVGGVGGIGTSGTVGQSGLTGTTGTNAAAARAGSAGGAVGAAGRGGAGMGGAYGAGGGGAGKGDKKSRNLVGYQVVRIEDDEDTPPVDPSLFGAGDAASLRPLEDDKDQDKW